MKDFILKVDHLNKTYPSDPPVYALRNVSFSIKAGSFVIITGPSGSGKSTLLNLLGTLDTPSSGKIEIDGQDPSNLKDDTLADFRREKIGFIFQMYHLLPTLTALENVVLPIVPYRRLVKFSIEQRAKDLLERVKLENRMNHLPGQLSGGEKQRVAIARSLINNPAIILADEPTGNLDSNSSKEIILLLRELNEYQKTTFLLVTHDTSVIQPTDYVFSLSDGNITQPPERSVNAGSADLINPH